MESLEKKIAEIVKARRAEMKKTQAELAEALGVDARTVQNIESENFPSVETLYQIARVMNLSIDEMFFGPSGATSETHARLERRIAECDEQQKKVLLATANALLGRE